MDSVNPDLVVEYFDVVIIGAGLPGIGAACHLMSTTPSKSYIVLESRSRIGASLDRFRYPRHRACSAMPTLGYRFKPMQH